MFLRGSISLISEAATVDVLWKSVTVSVQKRENIGPEKTPYLDTFYAVTGQKLQIILRIMFEQALSSNIMLCRSSSSEVLCKITFLKFFAKFTGKHLCQSLFFVKVASLYPPISLERRLFSIFRENFKNTYFVEHLGTAAFSIGKKQKLTVK